jgi:hypothetical protein
MLAMQTLDDILLWNPSLVNGNITGNCTLLPDYQYCINLNGTSKSKKPTFMCLSYQAYDLQSA